jgi:hypothetical protein
MAATVVFDCPDNSDASQIIFTIPSGLISVCEASVGVSVPDVSVTRLTPRPLRQLHDASGGSEGHSWRTPLRDGQTAFCSRQFDFGERLSISNLSYVEPAASENGGTVEA